MAWLLSSGSLRAQAIPASLTTGSMPLDIGYRQMYNLDFGGAHKTFQDWEQSHPQDPMGPVSDAAAYLFSEFDRLHVLEVDLFTDNDRFEKRQKASPDPAVRAAFDGQLTKAAHLATAALARSPQDANAMFTQVLINGLRGDYVALIEKRNLASLTYMKAGRGLAEKLLSRPPRLLRRLPCHWSRELPARHQFRACPLVAATQWGANRQGRGYYETTLDGRERALSGSLRPSSPGGRGSA